MQLEIPFENTESSLKKKWRYCYG